MTVVRSLDQTRHELVTARQNLRQLEYTEAVVKAEAESDIIQRAGDTLGKNAEDRKRNLILGLDRHQMYARVRAELSDAQADVDRLSAALEAALDRRREREWASRDRLTAVLERLALQQEAGEEPHDTVLTKLADSVSVEACEPARRFQVGDIVAFHGYPDFHGRVIEEGESRFEQVVIVNYDDSDAKNRMTYLASDLVLITPAAQKGS